VDLLQGVGAEGDRVPTTTTAATSRVAVASTARTTDAHGEVAPASSEGTPCLTATVTAYGRPKLPAKKVSKATGALPARKTKNRGNDVVH
jgi:hypothetical protein